MKRQGEGMDEVNKIMTPAVMERIKSNLPIFYNLDFSVGTVANDLIASTILALLQEDMICIERVKL